MTIEVQGLLQNRSVSSILQSAQFRRSLENVVRGRLIGSRTESTPAFNSSRRQRAEAPTVPPAPVEPTIPPPPPADPPSLDSISSSEASINLSIR